MAPASIILKGQQNLILYVRSHQAVVNKARRQTHPELNQVCGEPHEHYVPTPVRSLFQGLLMLGEWHSRQPGKRVRLELHNHQNKNIFK